MAAIALFASSAGATKRPPLLRLGPLSARNGFNLARSAPGVTAASTTYSDLLVGPVKGKHGFKVYFGADCNSSGSDYAYVEAINGSEKLFADAADGHHVLYHEYYDDSKPVSCSAANSLGSAKFTAHWGKHFKVNLKFGHAGKVKKIKAPPGCTGNEGYEREVKGKGSYRVDIHPNGLGLLTGDSVKAELEVYQDNYTCPPPSGTTPTYVDLEGEWDKGYQELYAYSASNTKTRYLEFYKSDNISGGIDGYLYDLFTARNTKLFSYKSNLTSAKTGPSGSLVTGSLTYKATDTCTDGETTGVYHGKLVLHDPVSGPVRYKGKQSKDNYLYRSNGTC